MGKPHSIQELALWNTWTTALNKTDDDFCRHLRSYRATNVHTNIQTRTIRYICACIMMPLLNLSWGKIQKATGYISHIVYTCIYLKTINYQKVFKTNILYTRYINVTSKRTSHTSNRYLLL